MTTLVYGPDGAPIVMHQGRQLLRANDASFPADRLQSMADEAIAKTVRSQGVSRQTVYDKNRGKPKPTPVTYETLRLMADRNEWVRAIIKTRKNQIGQVKWDVVVKDSDDPTGAAARAARAMRKLLQRPAMHGSRPMSTSWRQFLGLFLEDLLVIDQAVVEKERDGRKWIVALYNVDGATIRPNLDDYGGFMDDAYVQLVDGIVEARFGVEDVIVAMDNPQTNVRYAGYGMSPLENLIVSVTAELHASKYNASYFEKGSVPEGILSLGEDASPEDVDAFRLYWAGEIMGNPWALPIIGGSKSPEWMPWRDNNRDMQFMEYQQWLLQKLCAVYQISKQELGEIDDVNRSTADSQESSNERKGINPLLDLIKDYIDLEVIGEHGNGLGDYLEFQWEQVGESADQINAKFQPMIDAGAATRKEWREAHGMGDAHPDAFGAEGLAMHLASGQPQPLPSAQDAQTMGAAAQQDREDQQMQAQQERESQMTDAQREHEQAMAQQQAEGGGQASPTPWDRADANDPDTKAAMDAYDDEQGIGPRNLRKAADLFEADVAKVAPAGHDRNPAMTARTDSLDRVWERATERLVEGLAAILGGDG